MTGNAQWQRMWGVGFLAAVFMVVLVLFALPLGAQAADDTFTVNVDKNFVNNNTAACDDIRIELYKCDPDDVEDATKRGNALTATETETESNGSFTYTIDLSETSTLFYKIWLTKGGEDTYYAGGGYIDAKPGSFAWIYLHQVYFGYSSTIKGFDVKLWDADLRALEIGEKLDGFPLCALASDGYNIFKFESEATEDIKNAGYHSYTGFAKAYGLANRFEIGNLFVKENTLKLTVPTGTNVSVYSQNMVYGEKIPASLSGEVEESGGFKTYTYSFLGTSCSYEVTQSNYVTVKGSVATSSPNESETVEREVKKMTLASQYENQDYLNNSQTFDDPFEDGILLNVPDSGFLELEVDEVFWIDPWRNSQERDDNSKYVVTPDFKYAKVYESVSQTVALPTKGENAGRITAKKEGIAVIRVSYDPVIMTDGKEEVPINGIDPNQVGVIVVKVVPAGEKKTGDWDTGIDLLEYDTIYINDGVYINGELQEGTQEDTATYSFKAPDGATVEMAKVPTNPLTLSKWTLSYKEVSPDDEGNTNLILEEGRSIVRVTYEGETKYHVIRTLRTGVHVDNATTKNRDIAIGDDISIYFDNLANPVPKITKVYNPGFNYGTQVKDGRPTVRAEYTVNDSYTVQSYGTQYYLHMPSDNTITITADEAGTIKFDEGKVSLTVMSFGGLGAHKEVPEEGFVPGIIASAGESEIYRFSQLPEFEIEIVDKDSFMDKLNFAAGEITIDRMRIQDSGSPSATVIKNNVTRVSKAGKVAYQNIPIEIAGFNLYNCSMDDVTLYWRYWVTPDIDPQATPVVNGEETYITITKKVTDPISLENPLTTGNALIPDNPSIKDMVNAELVVVPNDKTKGMNKTYTLLYTSITCNNKLKDITIIPVDNKDKYYNTDGLLKAEPFEYKDETTGVVEKIDFGYGFLPAETEYTVTVPYDTENIKLLPEAMTYAINRISKHGSVVTVSVNGKEFEVLGAANEDGTKPLPATDEIDISEATEKDPVEITMTSTNNGFLEGVTERYDPITYTIKVYKSAEPANVDFNLPSWKSDVMVKNQYGTTMKSEWNGDYSLTPGTYQYTVYGGGYLAKTFDLTVEKTDDGFDVSTNGTTYQEKKRFEIEVELDKVPDQSGEVTVRIGGLSSVLQNDENLTIPDADDIVDLTSLANPFTEGGKPFKCVAYNYGGYTALHAVITALTDENGQMVEFKCVNGNLVPTLTINEDLKGENAGWVCMVNGVVVDPATTNVNGGDRVDFFYNPDKDVTTYARFDKSSVALNQGEDVTLTLYGTAIANTDSANAVKGLEGATVYVNGTAKGTTDAKGQVTLKATDLAANNNVTVEKLDSNGKNTLTVTKCIVNVKASTGVVPEDGKIAVTFRLIGDTLHESADSHGKYVNWIKTETHIFDASEAPTAYDAFMDSANEHGLKWDYDGSAESSTVYIQRVQAPNVLRVGGWDGWLGEFDNGQGSGWMYTVNGTHLQIGISAYQLKDGDEIVVHYVDDYNVEAPFNGGETYSWLEAEDKDPNEAEQVQTTVTPTVDESGKATVDVAAAELDSAIAAVKEKIGEKEVAGEVSLAVSGEGTSLEAGLPMTSLVAMASDEKNLRLAVESDLGTVTLDKAALTALTADAADTDTVKLVVAPVAESELSDEQKALVGTNPVFDISILKNDAKVSDFGEGNITIAIPYELKDGEEAANVCAYYLNEGKAEKVENSHYSRDLKAVVVETDHLSVYAVVYEAPVEELVPVAFTDVVGDYWAKEYIDYLSARKIVEGVTATEYQPKKNVTRAEFVTILARISGDVLPAAGDKFSDVKSDSWCAPYVAWAANSGVTTGMGDGTVFEPNTAISRQDMATMIERYVTYVGGTLADNKDEIKFADSDKISVYARNAVNAMVKAGIIDGYDKDGVRTFAPKDSATRAETAKMLAVLMQTMK